jgi:hypothetical protein
LNLDSHRLKADIQAMKLLLLTCLILLIGFQQQPQATVDREDGDVTVVKFSWSKYHPNDLIHPASDPGPALNAPVSMPAQPAKNEPAELRNRRDIQERRAALMNAEQNAKPSARPSDFYILKMEVKNVGPNTIKNIVWEVQPAVQTADAELKQYICTVKAKPNESKTFELMTPAAPVKVVSADKKSPEGKAVINRIEYADGSVWKRKGWSILIPKEVSDPIANGKCVMF